MLKQTLKEITGHSFFYALAWIASSAASIVLLPIYTRYLSRADYGILEVLDYTNVLLTIIIGAGFGAAVPKFLSDTESEEEKKSVISTATLFTFGAGALVSLVALWFNEGLASVVLGDENYKNLINLNIGLLYAQIMVFVSGISFIATKQSKTYFFYMLAKLVISILANLYFVVVARLGVLGMLYGNLLGNCVIAAVIARHNIALNGIAFNPLVLKRLLRFGAPLVPATFLATLMHNADRYLIRYFGSLDDVGIYSIGYKFPFMLNALIMQSFSFIWTGATMYEIAKKPDASYQYGRITTYVISVFILAQLSLCIFSDVVVRLLVDEKFHIARQVIPFIALGLCFHAFYFFFSVGAFVEKKTWLVNIAYLPAVVISIAGNIMFLPRFGYMAAAWVAVITYFLFAAILYLSCKRTIKIDYEFGRLGAIFAIAGFSFFISSLFKFSNNYIEVGKDISCLLLFGVGIIVTGVLTKGELNYIRHLYEERFGSDVVLQKGVQFKDRVNQVKEFWSHVLFRPRIGNSAFDHEAGLKDLEHRVCDWLSTIFPIPFDKWNKVSAIKYPQSEIFVFAQRECEEIPTKVVVKRFVMPNGSGNMLFPDELNDEYRAIAKLQYLSGVHNVFTPILYGYNENLCCMATSYLEGIRFVNPLLRLPLVQPFIASDIDKYRTQIHNLGLWLRSVHANGFDQTNDGGLRKTLVKDLAGIQVRVDNLSRMRPADFPSAICKVIVSRAQDLADRVLEENPPLRQIHGDFSLVNVLYDSQKLSVIDFAFFGQGLPEDDLARVYLDFVNIDGYTLMLSSARKGIFAEAFFDGYGKGLNVNKGVVDQLYLLKHAIINVYIYALHWGERQFLNPLLSRWLYSFQKKFLFKLLEPQKKQMK